MQKKSVLNFRQFNGVFEDDETVEAGAPVKAIDVVMNVFFEMYGTIVTRTGGYSEVVQDYQEISDAEAGKRGQLMVDKIDKISQLVLKKEPALKDAIAEYKKSAELLRQAYDKIVAEDKKQLLNIKNKIKNMVIDYLKNLVYGVKNTKVPEIEKKNESLEYIGNFLLEKDLYQKERGKVIKSIVPLRAKTMELANKSIFTEIKSKAKASLKQYDDLVKTLQDDTYFDGKKRTERAEEIQNSRYKIIGIENDLNTTLSQISIKYGIAKEIDDILKKSLSTLTSANTMLQDVEKTKAIEAEKTKVEDSVETQKEDGKKIIDSYGWKSIKDSEEKQVYYKKEDWNDSKTADSQKDQISVGKIVKGSIDETKKEVKIFNESTKKTFTKSISDILDKAEGDKYSTVKIKKEETKEPENKEYKEIKEGDKDVEGVKSVQKKLNTVLPKDSKLDENGQYDKKLKESVSKIIILMKSLSVLDDTYKEDTTKITPEFQKSLDEYIKKMEEIKKDLPTVK